MQKCRKPFSQNFSYYSKLSDFFTTSFTYFYFVVEGVSCYSKRGTIEGYRKGRDEWNTKNLPHFQKIFCGALLLQRIK
ncbi:hypothetical protein FVD81_09730 [Enterococcus faecium]|uniref:Uncharacterized protein n=1 Tax=Enterococcus faecium TaxID=1352 RepID=A0A7V7YBS1_ENTFC|nr:hypothetical protein F8181_10975 [Enterococcus faecium]KAB7547645.1 hypothetical protein GBM46_11260 [Enterococcus faecium]KAB7565087.1 hypothetical protein GBM31_11435 [Enterococcus faecium]KAB7578097.1 hypothetical protein GBM73_12700 [Enterococcus faecium]KAB7580537.1 hypothetical protein GBM37_08140 [Enterococcus faecium]